MSEEILPQYAGDEDDEFLTEALKKIRKDVKLEDLPEGLNPHFRYVMNNGEPQPKIIVLGATEKETSNVSNLKTMTDPLTTQARQDQMVPPSHGSLDRKVAQPTQMTGRSPSGKSRLG